MELLVGHSGTLITAPQHWLPFGSKAGPHQQREYPSIGRERTNSVRNQLLNSGKLEIRCSARDHCPPRPLTVSAAAYHFVSFLYLWRSLDVTEGRSIPWEKISKPLPGFQLTQCNRSSNGFAIVSSQIVS